MNQIIEHIKARDIKWLSLQAKEKGNDYIKKSRDAYKNSAILIASELGLTDVVEYCINIGCNINDINIAGDTPLILATKGGHFEIVELLTSKGAIVECANFVGNTPLHYAAFWRHGEIVVYLASTCDATVNVKNSFKRYPSDATSPSLKIYLEGVAEQQDRKDLIGVELVERTKLLDLHNVDWVIEPQDISIEQMMAETLHSKVYLATCRKAIVAVKVPKFNRALIAEEIKTITKEFHFLKTVVHHSLNAYFGVCTDKEFNICYMSPYQDGGTLEEVLFDASVEISQQEVLNYSLQICMAMQFLHSFNPPVCHGRLKPSNVLVNKAGKILISDFGFKDSVFNSGVFDPYHIYDPMWMAPELLMGQKYSDARAADVYSTALVLFSLITRAIPFNIQNPMVLGFQIAVNKLTPEMPAYIPANLVTHAN